MVIISALVCVYYNIIITWTVYYLFKSFSRVLPWSTCDNWWNTENCVDSYHRGNTTTNTTDNIINATNYMTEYNATMYNNTFDFNSTIKKHSSSEEYWE
jgi:solute carrier family 6 amino acid transporter-like protein 5/7/9/14